MSAAEQLPELDAEDARREALGAELSRISRGRVEAMGAGSWRRPGTKERGQRADEVIACGSAVVRQRVIEALHCRMRVLGIRTIGGEFWIWLAHRADGEVAPARPPRTCGMGPHIHTGDTRVCRRCLDVAKARAEARRGRPAGPMGFASLTAEARREVSARGGRTSAERGHTRRIGFTSASAKAANRIKSRHRLTSTEASEAGKLGAAANAEVRAERRAAIGIEARER